MSNINLKFHFHGGITSVFKDIDEETHKKLYEILQDVRHDSLCIGQQWINKNGIITVYPEVAEEVSQGSEQSPADAVNIQKE